MNDIDVTGILEEMKDRLLQLKQETVELNQKIDILKLAVRYKDGQITRDEMQAELKKIVYREEEVKKAIKFGR